MKWAVNGWQFSGKMFWRTGLPYAITDGNLEWLHLQRWRYHIRLGDWQRQSGGCGEGNANYLGNAAPCLNSAGLLDTGSNPVCQRGYPTQRRNQFRGPHYFDMDLNLFKNFKIAERFNLEIGAQAFNVFNHPNFSLPNDTFFTGDPTFGTIRRCRHAH